MIVNETQLAGLIGCSPRTVSNLIKLGMPAKGGKKRGTHWRIDTVDALQWYVGHMADKRAIDASGEVADIDQARLQKLVEEHRKLVIDNDAEESRLLPSDQVQKAFKAALAEFDSLLHGAAKHMARGNAELQRSLSDEHARILNTFAHRLSVFEPLPATPQ